MKTIYWFKKIGWFYLPIHFMGYITCLAGIAFLVPIFLSITHSGSSISDSLYQLFMYITGTAFWVKWVAENTCSNN